jgi:hypothetical protein
MSLGSQIRSALSVLVTIVGVALPIQAGAQTCTGNAAISRARSIQLRVGSRLTEGVFSYSGGLAIGNDNIFGIVGAGRTTYDVEKLSTDSVTVAAGFQVAADSSRSVVVCPLFRFTREWLPERDGLSATWNTGSAGLFAGFRAAETPTITFVPFLGISFGRTLVTAAFSEARQSDSYSDGSFTLGAGIVFYGRVAVTPSFISPFASDDTRRIFAVVTTVPLGT